ncbi:MAG TPA: hypothetical protein VMD53_17990 [Rhizomicrobium sp.]|nr:hypothetical protein [Rhizomicrobium sp.]
MAQNGCLFKRTAKFLSLIAIMTSCALFEPTMSFAQTDQPIIMTCDTTPVHVTLTINLTDKTARIELDDTRPQFQQLASQTYVLPISQITDQEITMPIPDDPTYDPSGQTAGQYYVLNRYTGDLRMITPAYPNSPDLYGPCQKQQKQF